MTRHSIMGCFVFGLCGLLSLPALAAESVLSLVPDDAMGFLVVRDVESSSSKIGKFAEQLGSDVPPQLTSLRAELKAQLGVNKGFDDHGDILVAIMPGEEQPQPLLALPVSDYDALVTQLEGDPSKETTEVTMANQSLVVARKGDHAVFVDLDSREALRKLISRDTKAQAAAHPLGDWVADNDVTVVVLKPGLKFGFGMASAGLSEASASLAEVAGEQEEGQQEMMDQARAGLEMYQKALKFLGREIQTAAIGLDVDDAGNLKVGGRLLTAPGGKLASLADAGSPVVKAPLADIPNKPYVGCMAMSWQPEWGETMMQWSISMMKMGGNAYGLQDVSDEDMKKMTKASKPLMDVMESFSMFALPGEDDAPIYSDMFYVMKVTDSADYLEGYEKYIKAWNELTAGDDAPAMKFESAMVKIEDREALELKMDTSAMMAVPAAGDPQAQAMMQQMMQEMMEKMFGPDGVMTMYLVVVDKNTVITSIGTKEQMIAALNALDGDAKARLSENSDVQVTAALLPKDAMMVGYLNPQGTMAWFQRVLGIMGPMIAAPQLPEAPDTPPIGFSARLNGDTVETELVVPAGTIKGIGEFVQEIQQLVAEP